jgi:hypothetical protein
MGPLAGALVSDAFGYPAAFIAAGASELLCVAVFLPMSRMLLRASSASLRDETK